MNLMNMDIQTYVDGKASFIVELSNKINLPEIFNKALTQNTGRPVDILWCTCSTDNCEHV